MDIMLIVNTLFEDEKWYSLHDAVYNATGVSHTEEKLKELFLELPKHIQHTAFEWGLSDTVFRDEVYVYITQQMAAAKEI